MSQAWVDVSIQAQIDGGELLGILDDPAVQGAWEEPGVVHLYWAEDQWNGDRLAMLQQLLSRLNHAESHPFQVSVNLVPAQDWNQQWARSVKPLRIGRLVIRPSWESVELLPDEREIILDPKQAFGTGHHATTRMLLEWLQDKIRGGEVLLDVGTGSGILAMAALRFGADSAIGVEYDPVAVECARDYLKENGFGPDLELICGTLQDVDRGIRPDLVLANLDRQTLLVLLDDLATYGIAGARLIFSGVLVEQEAEVVAAYSERGLYLVDRREQDGWVALELGCPESCEGGV
jgi:ribosomal protein L11 methyltransferase